ncbi:MAG: DUF4197 domain-containing protein [Mariprofundus sp.]|nr:DUF4197 domain-containing protein [Mariprofundus sp.]
MIKHTLVKTALLCSLLLFSGSLAFAGWLDQAGGVLEQLDTSSHHKQSKTTSPISSLSNSDVVAGLKDALRIGSEHVVGQLGKNDGFNADPKIHIPLPAEMKQVKSALAAIGMSSMMDDLELKLNRAAEMATPKAKKLFGDAIKAMTIADAKTILAGTDDAATQYFKAKMSKPLAKEMNPIVQQAMTETGAVQAYDSVMGKYKTLPFVPDVKANLTKHVIEGGLKGIFSYMASEEAAIRKNPVARTTSLLKKVFAN